MVARAIAPEYLRERLASGARIVDVREPPAFAERHVRGSLNVALSNRSAPYWLNALVVPEAALIAVTASERDGPYVERLFDAAERQAAAFAAFDEARFEAAGIALASLPLITPDALAEEPERFAIVDVREPREYAAGHVPDAISIPLDELASRLDEVPAGPVATICASGFRSSTAASLLEAAGRGEVANVWGGTTAWMQMGLPLASGARP